MVTELLVRIQPLPADAMVQGLCLPTVEAAWRAMQDIMQANLWPSVLRLYDPVDTKMAARPRRPTPRLAAECSAALSASSNPALKRHLMSIPLAMPGLLNRIGEA